jgi:hypothetical protein
LLWDRATFTSELARRDGDFISRNALVSGFSCLLRECCGRGYLLLERSLHFVVQKRGPLPFRQFRALGVAETRASPEFAGWLFGSRNLSVFEDFGVHCGLVRELHSGQRNGLDCIPGQSRDDAVLVYGV